jgi:hypothetical protein
MAASLPAATAPPTSEVGTAVPSTDVGNTAPPAQTATTTPHITSGAPTTTSNTGVASPHPAVTNEKAGHEAVVNGKGPTTQQPKAAAPMNPGGVDTLNGNHIERNAQGKRDWSFGLMDCLAYKTSKCCFLWVRHYSHY